MRNELKIIEIIEKYLNNELSEADRKAFEEKLKNNPKLQEEVEKQRLLQEGIKNAGLRSKVTKAYQKFRMRKLGTNLGIISLVAIATAAVIYFATTNNKEQSDEQSFYKENIKYELNENGANQWADADELIKPQFFSINAEKDTVLITESGMVIAIPEGALLENGKPVKGNVEVEIKEAINPEDILTSGLSSMSGDDLLETGGMFYFNARKNGNNLEINENNSVTIDVPTNNIKEGMQLYDGVRKEDGTIDWQNPKPIEQFLTTVDITTLDFYPPRYEIFLAEFGKGDKTKHWKDSLYYSFSEADSSYTIKENYKSIDAKEMIISLEKRPYISDNIKDSLKDRWTTYDTVWHKNNYQINPAIIKTIWDKKFNNTLLATKEFEERLSYIFQTCDNSILELYINNLDKRLSTIDSMVVEKLCGEPISQLPEIEELVAEENETSNEMDSVSGAEYDMTAYATIETEYAVESAEMDATEKVDLCAKFKEFAAQNKGRVKTDSKAAQILSAYYEKQVKANAEALAKTQQEFWKKYNDLLETKAQSDLKHQQKERERLAQNFQEEYDLNLKEACRQLGIVKNGTISEEQYRIRINNPGWKNVDRAVFESVTNRETHTNGKTAVIKYEACKITVENNEKYEKTFVYLMPRELNSFQRMKAKGEGVFEENLNELIQYQLVAVGMKDNKIFVSKIDELQPQSYTLNLEETPKKEFRKMLRKGNLKSVRNDVIDDVKYELGAIVLNKEKTYFEDMVSFREYIKEIIFPCYTPLVEGVPMLPFHAE